MKFILPTVIVWLLMASVACATDFDNPLSQGRVTLKGQAGATNLDALDTASLAFYRVDNGDRVFCVDAGPGALVEGISEVINKRSGDIFVELVAHTAADCSDLPDAVPSDPSADRYKLRFGKPGEPIIVEVVPAP